MQVRKVTKTNASTEGKEEQENKRKIAGNVVNPNTNEH